MNKFEMLRRISDISKFSALIFDAVQNMNNQEELETFLSEELTEEGLQAIKVAAQQGYPISLDSEMRGWNDE